MKKLLTIKDIPDLCGKRVLLRLDFNVSIEGGIVRDDYRIRASLPTIDFLRHAGARTVIISHIESAEGTLRPVYEHMTIEMGQSLSWCDDILVKGAGAINNLKEGAVLLAENIRMYPGEKGNDQTFAKQLASLVDIYVNDAFSVSHRLHASIVGIPTFIPHYSGLQLDREIEEISKSFNPAHPFLFILGGAKFDTKLPLIQKFISRADTVFIGGALANNFFKEAGYEVGTSVVSGGFFNTKALMETKKVVIPSDVVVNDHTNKEKKIASCVSVNKDQKIWDVGPETMKNLGSLTDKASFILWNGPLGGYEDGYVEPTLELARRIAERTKAGAYSIVGGGDTIAAITTLGIEKDFSFVSTGGGAMIDFLANETLPGIEALG